LEHKKTVKKMNQLKQDVLRLATALLAVILVSGLLARNTIVGEVTKNGVHPEKFMLRMSAYTVGRADTTLTVLSHSHRSLLAYVSYYF
jgi:hypothetical protein